MTRAARRSLASFDSATAIVRAVARFLRGKDMRALGVLPGPLAPAAESVVPLVNCLPEAGRERVYALGGRLEAVPASKLGQVSAERLAGWVTSRYPPRRYPAVVLGSSSGALAHLCAALGAPFLPQTLLVPVRHPGLHADEPRDGLEAAREPARRLREANPELQLHHMHDPVQDRLMLTEMTYFRVKRLRLGRTYERFLTDALPRGGTIVAADCGLRWPVTEVAERHLFQFGALGGVEPAELRQGSERIARYLERYRSHRRDWDSPEPTGERPEAEWGFEPALMDDIMTLADRRGWRVLRLSFADPEDLSPPVADFYRNWYLARRIEPARLLVESFMLLDPLWALRTGSVPLWLKFAVEPSARRLDGYLAAADRFPEVALTLFSHGVESPGYAPIERWPAEARLLGVDADLYPRDFGVFARFGASLRELPERHPLPEPVPVNELAEPLALELLR